ncbi:MAG: hypothetical protein ACD_24C00206G0002 [uncultured bacterium]|nr:MAG: hypothetical protein ACD_24C00206G0002 [uncultured bacterium]
MQVEKRRTVAKAKDFLVIKDDTKNKEQRPKKIKTTLLLSIHSTPKNTFCVANQTTYVGVVKTNA